MLDVGRSDRARVPPARRLPAQAPEPDEVPDQVAGLGGLPGRVRDRAARKCWPRAARRCRSIPSAPPVEEAPDWARRDAPPIGRVAGARASGAGHVGARHSSRTVRPACSVADADVPRVAARATSGRRSSGLRGRHRHGAARRPHRRADARRSRTSRAPTATARVRMTLDQDLIVALGADRRARGALRRGWRPPASAWPTRALLADVTSCPGAESCRLAVTQSRGLGRAARRRLASSPALVGRRAGPHSQDQRLPERVRPASHRRHRLPGQHPQARRTRRCRSTS